VRVHNPLAPKFEVASIKRNKSGNPPVRLGTEGSRFIAENYQLNPSAFMATTLQGRE